MLILFLICIDFSFNLFLVLSLHLPAMAISWELLTNYNGFEKCKQRIVGIYFVSKCS